MFDLMGKQAFHPPWNSFQMARGMFSLDLAFASSTN